MDERERAEAWVRGELELARAAFERQPPGPHDLTLEQYEQKLRGRADAILRPTAQYVGLPLDAAEATAAQEGDHLCVHRGQTGHRADWRAGRVHVELDAHERVVAARRDSLPWQQRS